MEKRFAEKTKMRYIIKAYLLLKGEATANELYNFLKNNYQWNTPLTIMTVSGALTGHGHHPNDVIYGLKRRKSKSTSTPIRYYLEVNCDD